MLALQHSRGATGVRFQPAKRLQVRRPLRCRGVSTWLSINTTAAAISLSLWRSKRAIRRCRLQNGPQCSVRYKKNFERMEARGQVASREMPSASSHIQGPFPRLLLRYSPFCPSTTPDLLTRQISRMPYCPILRFTYSWSSFVCASFS
ncbi:Hypothetical protein HDN1F_17510 [gamma proteobacterium HdN1]|nr:Hypothetical protein HDN1F_17510 [gamma proteobacterium HdN1]